MAKKRAAKGKKSSKSTMKDMCKMPCSSDCGGVYGLGFIGALVYYISTATGFWNGVWGVIKALLWPAFLVFELLKYLQM